MNDFFVSIQGGARICVPAALGNLTTFILLEQETWFEDEFRFARACVSPGDCAVDVGANLGVFTTALAAGVGPAGRVLAFEPTASTVAFLRRTVQAGELAQVTLVQAALSDRRGQALLQIGESPELNALTDTPMAGGATECVELLTLDDVAREHGAPNVAFVKIDAEGHELQVARGSAQLLKAAEPLVMFEIQHGDTADYRLLDDLAPLGFDAYRLVPGLGMLVPFRRDEPADGALLNLFACTPARARALEARGLLSRDGARLAPLVQAQRLAAAALKQRSSIGRALTFARLCADLGQRSRAVEVLAGLVPRVQQAGPLLLDEPCRPPLARYDAVDPGADPTPWLQSAVVEGYLRLSAFSSVYQGAEALPALEYLIARPYVCAEMERRRQLLRLALGHQARPEPHALLLRDTPDNLNSWFWSGRG